MNAKLSLHILVAFFLLSAVPPARAEQAMPAGPTAPAGLLQFTAGGHALGFAAGGMYAAAADHALHVEFAGAHAVQPQPDSPAGDGQAVPLGRVVYPDLWDGITLAYSAAGGGIYASTYTLAPGADPSAIRLTYNVTPGVNSDGSLGIAFTTGALTESAPVAWQDVDGRRVPVDASFRMDGQEVTFALGAYNPRYALTIDPTLVWNTFLGGSGDDLAYGIAMDASGNIFVAGYSDAAWGSQPVRAYTAGQDVLVAKLNSSGSVVWFTFLGGSGNEQGQGIAVDGSGNVYLSGFSDATWGSPVRAYSGGYYDSFAAKLNSSGQLLWNTFLDKTITPYIATRIAVDGSGNSYVAGSNDVSWGNPKRAYSGSGDAFVAKLNSSGTVVWNTFLGGSSSDYGCDIVVDGSGDIFVAGYSYDAWGYFPPGMFGGGSDIFVAKLTSSGKLSMNYLYGVYGNEKSSAIALRGNYVYVTGTTDNICCTNLNPIRDYSAGTDAFVAKINTSTFDLTWWTFLGGSGSDDGNGITTDRGGNIYVVGTSSASWGSPLRAFAGGSDAFAAKLAWNGSLLSSAFLGGSGYYDVGEGIAFDGSGTYVAGWGDNTWGSPLRGHSSYQDVSVARIVLPHICDYKALELFDLTGDCRTDVALYRPATGAWHVRNQYYLYYGAAGDIPVPGDYDGDGITDIAVYRPATGAWYIRNQYSAYYGASGDQPVPGDYNGDGTTEIAVYRPSTGAWYVRGMSTVYYGTSADIPVPGDYDGDGTTEIAVYRPSTGAWYVRGQATVYYGVSTDVPVPGDYDGDVQTEIAVYRPSSGAWYVQGLSTVYYGSSTDLPIPGDYDGDGTTDIAVFRPATGAWYVRGMSTVNYGTSGDIPLPEMGTGNAGTAP
jgi:hypothetical protein